MSGYPASLSVLFGLGLILAPLVSLGTALLWPLVRRALRGRSATTRGRAAWLAAVAPVLLPAAVVVLCVLPGLGGALVGIGDHCAVHGDHPHFCPVHATVALPPVGALLLLAFAALASPLAFGLVDDLRRSRREARWLARRRAGPLAPGIHRLESARPIALTHGLLRPQVWIARALERALSPEEREVVLAHERAHVARRDPARLATASLASRIHLPGFRGRILSELRSACEEACDARAAQTVGDPLFVAATLLRVERLLGGGDPALRLAAPLVDASLPARIEALLAADASHREDRVRSAARRGGATRARLFGDRTRWPFALALLAIALARPIHHLAEHGLDLVLRAMVGVGALF